MRGGKRLNLAGCTRILPSNTTLAFIRRFCLKSSSHGTTSRDPAHNRMSYLFWQPLAALLLHALLLVDVYNTLALDVACANQFAASSLAVMTAGVTSTFTITATDYPGNPCTLGSETFGFDLMPFSGNYSFAGRDNSQWSVTPSNQFVLPLAVTASGVYSAQIVRLGKLFVQQHRCRADALVQGWVLMQPITKIRF